LASATPNSAPFLQDKQQQFQTVRFGYNGTLKRKEEQ
jgi:hypothetical protein